MYLTLRGDFVSSSSFSFCSYPNRNIGETLVSRVPALVNRVPTSVSRVPTLVGRVPLFVKDIFQVLLEKSPERMGLLQDCTPAGELRSLGRCGTVL